MYSFLSKSGQAIAFGFGAIISIAFFAIIMGGLDDYSLLDGASRFDTSIFNFGLYAVVVLTVIAALCILVFGLLQIGSDFKGSMKGLIGFGALLVIAGIAYTMADPSGPSSVTDVLEKFNITQGTSKMISAAMTLAGSLGLLAVIGLIFSEVRNFFK